MIKYREAKELVIEVILLRRQEQSIRSLRPAEPEIKYCVDEVDYDTLYQYHLNLEVWRDKFSECLVRLQAIEARLVKRLSQGLPFPSWKRDDYSFVFRVLGDSFDVFFFESEFVIQQRRTDEYV